MRNQKISTVSAVAVMDLANELLNRKVLTHSQLVKLVPGFTQIENQSSAAFAKLIQEQREDESCLVDLWQAVDRLEDTETIGLEIGLKVNDQAKGVLANWLSQSDTLGQALAIFRQNIVLLNPSEHWQLESMDGSSHSLLVFNFESPFQYPRMAYERSMIALIAWGEHLCGQKISLEAVEFTFPKPAYHRVLSEIFGGQVAYGCSRNSIQIASEVLNRPLVSANAYLHAVISERASELLDAIKGASSFSEQVATLIRNDIRGFSQIDALANALCMSRATLYRKLKEENISYQVLLNSERKQAAVKALKDKTKIEVISDSLGFTDKRSFYKAYKRWFNRSPYESGHNKNSQ